VGLLLPADRALYDRSNDPIAGAPGCRTHDIVYPDLRTTNGWDSSFKIDVTRPCAQAHIDSLAAQFANWGYDLLKLDGVGPGSDKTGSQYDNTTDVKAWHDAIERTGRRMQLVLSWSLDPAHIADWQRYSDGWRFDQDVECYCKTLVRWNRAVVQRFHDLPHWVALTGPQGGNNLDSLDVGNGAIDGLTDDERRSYVTLWAISAAPLYTGDDLTHLDPLGRQLLTTGLYSRSTAPVAQHPRLSPTHLDRCGWWRTLTAAGRWRCSTSPTLRPR